MKNKNILLIFIVMIAVVVLFISSPNLQAVDTMNIVKNGEPTITASAGKVDGSIPLKNIGASMTTTNVIEMQVQPKGVSPQAVLSEQRICDVNFPNNVHKAYQLASNEAVTITLSSTNLPAGEYDIYLTTATRCWVPGDIEDRDVSPYNYNTFIKTVTVPLGTCTPTCSIEGQKTCHADGKQILECKMVNGCLRWQAILTCPLSCSSGSCSTTPTTQPSGTYYCILNGACDEYSSIISPNCYTSLSTCQEHISQPITESKCQIWEQDNNGKCEPNWMLIGILGGLMLFALFIFGRR